MARPTPHAAGAAARAPTAPPQHAHRRRGRAPCRAPSPAAPAARHASSPSQLGDRSHRGTCSALTGVAGGMERASGAVRAEGATRRRPLAAQGRGCMRRGNGCHDARHASARLAMLWKGNTSRRTAHRRATYSVVLQYSSTHGTHGTHSTHDTHGTHGTHSTHSSHDTHSTHDTRSTHGTHGNHGTRRNSCVPYTTLSRLS